MAETYWEISFRFWTTPSINSMRLDTEAEAWAKWDELQANPRIKSTMLRKVTVEAGGHDDGRP